MLTYMLLIGSATCRIQYILGKEIPRVQRPFESVKIVLSKTFKAFCRMENIENPSLNNNCFILTVIEYHVAEFIFR
jgi:hypothetical protein